MIGHFVVSLIRPLPILYSTYHINPIYWDNLTPYHSYPKTWTIPFYYYCAFDIFQKVIFCLTLYTEVNLQVFVMI